MRSVRLFRNVIGIFCLLVPSLAWAQQDMRIPADVRRKVEKELGKDAFKRDVPPPSQLEEAAKRRTMEKSSKLAEEAAKGRGEITRRRRERDEKDLREFERYNTTLDDAWEQTKGWGAEMQKERNEEKGNSLFSTFLITLALAAGAYFFFMNRYMDS
ncbi:MAG: hypothetical protein D6795_07795 [Deltaproteobacteria bacterium]|nr:MAG: hypothetical protein D6795_07795 [Deltaproteobacteria bacterium]